METNVMQNTRPVYISYASQLMLIKSNFLLTTFNKYVMILSSRLLSKIVVSLK